MKRDLFRRYVWLIDTVRHAKKIQFEDIAQRWLNAPLNADHSQLALRTFHNHRHAIENLFGIRIICDRGDHNRYYIADWSKGNATKLKVWMLQKLTLSNLDKDTDPVKHRILIDLPPEERYGFISIIDAIQKNRVIKLVCAIPTSDNKTSLLVAPYCLRHWRGQWFFLGKDTETNLLHAFNFDRVLDISLTDTHFDFPHDFSPEIFFSDYFGMDINAKILPEVVRLKIGGRTRDEVRTLPLHNSQKEIMTQQEYSIFEFYLVPSEKFQTTILSHGTDTEVVYPESLRHKIGEKIRNMAERYARCLESTYNTYDR